MDKILLDIVTPEKTVVKSTEVDAVILPGINGQMSILPGHVNLMTGLRGGSFAYMEKGTWQWAALSSGFAQVVDNRVRVLAETMELAHEIDVARAGLARDNAIQVAKSTKAGTAEYIEAEAARARAELRLELASKK